MPYVNDKTYRNAKKCLDCSLVKFGNVDKTNVLAEDATRMARGLGHMVCNVCENGKDYKKINGVNPVDDLLRMR